MKRLFSLALALSLLAVVVAPASAQTCIAQYTVKPGDNLFRIGLAHNVPWPVIAAANKLANPSLIFPGQVLCIPGITTPTPGPSATTGPTATARPTNTPGPTATAVRTATPGPTATAGPTPTQFPVPTFSIIGVARNASVTIQTANFPANQTFNIYMGSIGTRGYGGQAAGTVNSGAGGVFTTTITIPSQMANAEQIAILLQSASGYYSYNWFWNYNYP